MSETGHPSVKRFILDQFVKLLVFGVPLAVLAWFANMQLEVWAENNRREQLRFQQESETARQKNRLWESLYDSLTEDTTNFHEACGTLRRQLTLPSKEHSVYLLRRTKPHDLSAVLDRIYTEQAQVNRTLLRIRAYGIRDYPHPRFAEQLDLVLGHFADDHSMELAGIIGKHYATQNTQAGQPYLPLLPKDDSDALLNEVVTYLSGISDLYWDSEQLLFMMLDPDHIPIPAP